MAGKFYPTGAPHGWQPRASVGTHIDSGQLASAGTSLTALGALLGDPELALLRARAALRDECEGPDSLAAMLGLPYVGAGPDGARVWVTPEAS